MSGLGERASQVSGAVLGEHEQFKHVRLVAFVSGFTVTLGIIVAMFSGLSTSPDHISFGTLLKQAGMIATILDVYAGIALFSAWVYFRENGKENKLVSISWILLFICTGNIGTCIYLFRAASKAAGDWETLLFGNRRFEFGH
jgi:hypothetical protein